MCDKTILEYQPMLPGEMLPEGSGAFTGFISEVSEPISIDQVKVDPVNNLYTCDSCGCKTSEFVRMGVYLYCLDVNNCIFNTRGLSRLNNRFKQSNSMSRLYKREMGYELCINRN